LIWSRQFVFLVPSTCTCIFRDEFKRRRKMKDEHLYLSRTKYSCILYEKMLKNSTHVSMWVCGRSENEFLILLLMSVLIKRINSQWNSTHFFIFSTDFFNAYFVTLTEYEFFFLSFPEFPLFLSLLFVSLSLNFFWSLNLDRTARTLFTKFRTWLYFFINLLINWQNISGITNRV
jgi:hypothetical protein